MSLIGMRRLAVPVTAAFASGMGRQRSGCEAPGSDEPRERPTKDSLFVHARGVSDAMDIGGSDRYVGYSAALARLKLILLRAKSVAAQSMRYIAYSSDIGESMRPVLSPQLVNMSYGVAIAYVLADTGIEVRRKHHIGYDSDVLIGTAAHRLVFHAAVSLALPAVIIHTAVHQSHKWLDRPMFEAMPRVHRYGPTAVGLAIIPFLPILDHPAEHILEIAFDRAWPKWRLGEEDNIHHKCE